MVKKWEIDKICAKSKHELNHFSKVQNDNFLSLFTVFFPKGVKSSNNKIN